MELSLRDLQGLLERLITATDGVDAALARETALPPNGIDGILARGPLLGARDRVEIYSTAYFHRLLGSLKEDYPATLAVLGEADFRKAVVGYLAAHPSRSASVFFVGERFPDFIRRNPISRERPFLAELAKLERTLIDVFHAPDSLPPTAEKMRAIPPERWPALQLRLNPAAALIDCKWPVDEILDLVLNGKPIDSPAPQPAAILVWRQHDEVYRRRLDRSEQAALALLGQGVTFAEVCEVAANHSADDPIPQLNLMFSRWLADELIVDAET